MVKLTMLCDKNILLLILLLAGCSNAPYIVFYNKTDQNITIITKVTKQKNIDIPRGAKSSKILLPYPSFEVEKKGELFRYEFPKLSKDIRVYLRDGGTLYCKLIQNEIWFYKSVESMLKEQSAFSIVGIPK